MVRITPKFHALVSRMLTLKLAKALWGEMWSVKPCSTQGI